MTAPVVDEPRTDIPDAAEVLATVENMDRPRWLDLRRRGIGGSDAAAIAGLDPHRSAFAVWLEKTGQDTEDLDNEAAYWGRKLEPYVADRFAEDTGLTVRDHHVLLASTARPWQLANVDRFVAPAVDARSDAFLECKTVNPWDGTWGRAGDDMSVLDVIPERAAVQTLHYLDVTGYQRAHVAVLIGGQRFRRYVVERDEGLLEHLRSIEAAFWQQVIDRVPPIPTAVDSDLLAHLYDAKPGSVVQLDEHATDVLQLIAVYREAKAAMDAAETSKDGAANKLKGLLGENEIGTLNGIPVVTWKEQSRAGYEVKPTTFRRFNIPKGA